MKSRLILAVLIFFVLTQAKGQFNFEQYCYVKNKKMGVLVPIMNYETSNHLYAEMRYNYEELNALSLYIGKSVSELGKVTYTVIPIFGIVVGGFRGGSLGVNAAFEYSDFFFSTQSQYTVSINRAQSDYYFGWSEFGYQPMKWLYAGLTVQQTYAQNVETLYTEPGVVLGFSLGKVTVPLYVFNPTRSSNYFIVGINLTTGGLKKRIR